MRRQAAQHTAAFRATHAATRSAAFPAAEPASPLAAPAVASPLPTPAVATAEPATLASAAKPAATLTATRAAAACGRPLRRCPRRPPDAGNLWRHLPGAPHDARGALLRARQLLVPVHVSARERRGLQ